ncbi:MAG: hypothetical protein Q8K98_05450 [Bacteroidota bacterium]|nr:hypothetical protein [Bacteroidota bacterium]
MERWKLVLNNRNVEVDISPEDFAWADALDSQYPYLPKRTWVYIPYAEVPLYEIGFSLDRLNEIKHGAEPTFEEQSIIRWAILLTRAVSEAVRNIDTDKELDFIIKASDIAHERLDNEQASRVQKALRQILTETPLVEWYIQVQNKIVGKIFKDLL